MVAPSKQRHSSRLQDLESTFDQIVVELKDLYQGHQYAAVVEQTSSALQSWRAALKPEQQIILLDFKCTAQEKLKDLDTAIDTAKALIRIDKKSGLGYIRAASIEKGRDNFKIALRYLDHGLSRVPTSDKYFKRMELHRPKIALLSAKAEAAARAADPLGVFPLEILQLILSYLEYRQVITMTRVSKGWRRVLCALEPVVDTLDVRKARKGVSYPQLRVALARLKQPKTLAIDKLSATASDMMSRKLNVWKTWTSLECLVLNDSRISTLNIAFEKFNLRSIHLGGATKVPTNVAFRILDTCPGLTQAIFRSPTGNGVQSVLLHQNLQTLELGNTLSIDQYSFPLEVLRKYPNLVSLKVRGCGWPGMVIWDLRDNVKLTCLDTYACGLEEIRLPSSLCEWYWKGSGPFRYPGTSLDQVPSALPNLHTVHLGEPNTIRGLQWLLASGVKPGQIRNVAIQDYSLGWWLSEENNMLNLLSEAQELSVESGTLIDPHVTKFVQRWPNIQSLRIVAPQITGGFIVDLVRSLGKQIKELTLVDCSKVAPDTIVWLRQQDIDTTVMQEKKRR